MSTCPHCSSNNTHFDSLSSTAMGNSFVTGGKSDPNTYTYHYSCSDCLSEFEVNYHQGVLSTMKKG